MFEAELLDALIERGERAEPQYPVGPKNLDIAVPPVAVEVWLSSSHPHRDRYCLDRIEYLANRGWSTVYVFISRRTRAFDVGKVADEVIRLAEVAKSNPAPLGQHWMVRGTGDGVTRLSLNDDPRP